MDARWVDVEDALARSVHHFRMAALMFERHKDLLVLEPESERAYEAKMALMHAVQSGYVSFEGMLKRILHLLGEDVPGGPSSHADLLQRVGKRLRSGLIEHLASLTLNIVALPSAPRATFTMLSRPTPLQAAALERLGANLSVSRTSQP